MRVPRKAVQVATAVAGAYAIACGINWAVIYFLGRSGSPTLFGSASLVDLNTKLLRWNILAKIIDPLTVAQKLGTSNAPPAPSSTGAPPLIALPTATERFSMTDPNWMGL